MNPAIIKDVRVDDELITFVLTDGREVSGPTSWSARLTRASDQERRAWKIGGFGTYAEWPSIDEHVGVWTLLGVPEEDVMAAAGFEISRPAVRA
jgi:hypothetical protein